MKLPCYLFTGLLLLLLTGCGSAPTAMQEAGTATDVAVPASEQVVQPTAPPSAPSAVFTPLPTSSPEPSPTVPQALLSTVTAAECPVTIANGNAPPGESTFPNIHGNGALWTGLWPNGILRATPDYVQSDGSIDMKFWWWRGPDVRGPLTIEGQRLDVSAPPVQAYIPDGYGDTGFQASGIVFPTEGCWEVTGKAADAELTFVTFVVKDKQ